MRRPARRHRLRVRARRRDDDRGRPRPARAGALPRRPARARSRASTTPATSPRSRALVEEHDVRLIVPLTDLDHVLLVRRARRARRAPAAAGARRSCGASATSTSRTCFFEERGIASPPTLAAGRGARTTRAFPVLVKARRASARGTSTAPHDRAELDFFLRYTTRRLDRADRAARARSSRSTSSATSTGRCLNAIPRTMIESKGGESIKGMTIKDWELIEYGAHVAEALGRSSGPANDPVLPRGRRPRTR